MKQKINLGIVCLARDTFDYEAAKEIYNGIISELNRDESITLHAIPGVVMEPQEARRAGDFFSEKHVDGIAVISGTFHLGHLALEIKKQCDKPLLLWALPELPYNGGKIRLNSVCGLNLNASNLTKSGYTDFTYTLSDTIDADWVAAIRMIAALRKARIGILGYRAHGFFNVGADELALYKKYGCLTDHYELADVIGYPEKKERADYYSDKIKGIFDTSSITAQQVSKTAILAAKLEGFMSEKDINVLAVRCWPEFARDYGIAPCAAMSLAQDEGCILACEGDIDCGITMLAHQAAGADTPFMADLSQVNLQDNFALMWHCGVAPCSLCDGICTPTLDTYFASGKGVTAGFAMKRGAVSIARLDSVGGRYRLIQEKGQALHMQKQLTGTYAKCQFERGMREVLDKVVYSGAAHHFSMVYGDYTKPFEIFARLTATEVL
jgi:L-fucose isomerase-like protein